MYVSSCQNTALLYAEIMEQCKMKNKSLLGICTEINNMGAVLMIAIVPI